MNSLSFLFRSSLSSCRPIHLSPSLSFAPLLQTTRFSRTYSSEEEREERGEKEREDPKTGQVHLEIRWFSNNQPFLSSSSSSFLFSSPLSTTMSLTKIPDLDSEHYIPSSSPPLSFPLSPSPLNEEMIDQGARGKGEERRREREREGETGIAVITLDNPGKRNSLDLSMMYQFSHAVSLLSSPPFSDCTGVIIKGKEGGGFCAGANLDSLPPLSPSLSSLMCNLMTQATSSLFSSSRVVVAVIGGGKREGEGPRSGAIGGGAELSTCADFRFISDQGIMQFVQAKHNITPGWGGGKRLVSLIGKKNSLLVLAGSRPLLPHDAEKIGLVDLVVSRQEEEKFVELAGSWIALNFPSTERNIGGVRGCMEVVKCSGNEREREEREKEVFAERSKYLEKFQKKFRKDREVKKEVK